MKYDNTVRNVGLMNKRIKVRIWTFIFLIHFFSLFSYPSYMDSVLLCSLVQYSINEILISYIGFVFFSICRSIKTE